MKRADQTAVKEVEATEEPKKQRLTRPIAPNDVYEIGYLHRMLTGMAPAGTEIEDVEKPALYASIGMKLRPFDRIMVISADEPGKQRWVRNVLVCSSEKGLGFSVVAEPPVLLPPRSDVEHRLVPEGHEVRYVAHLGTYEAWRVVPEPLKMCEGLQTWEQARDYIANHATLRRT